MKGYSHLNQVHRCIIEWGFRKGKTQTEIADMCGVHRATISRELKRHTAVKTGVYNAIGAHGVSLSRKLSWINYTRKIKGPLEEVIIEKLNEKWSPEQISGRLKEEGKQSVCHESIYRWLYRIADRPELKQILRRFRSRNRRGKKRQNKYLSIERRKYIDKRPVSVESRKVKGHWERDLLLGKREGHSLLTLVERKTRYTLIKKVPSRRCEVVNTITANLINTKSELEFKTITNDNGGEFGQPSQLEKLANVKIYFNYPHSPWQRGSIENLNGLLRQYYPKAIDLNQIKDKEISMVEYALNHRPRKNLGFKTPHEVMFKIKEKLFKSREEYRRNNLIREFKSYLNFLKMCCD